MKRASKKILKKLTTVELDGVRGGDPSTHSGNVIMKVSPGNVIMKIDPPAST